MNSVPPPTFREALLFWLKLGFISFGGPAGQITMMHTELVERRKWVDEGRFMHALNFCMLLPGPEATQLAIYIGWLLHRVRGGIAAGVLFILPSALILWGLSWVYAAYGSVPAVQAVFYGLKPAVMAIVASAVLRIGSRALKTPVMWGIAAVAWVLAMQTAWHVPFPALVFGAGVIGFLGHKWWPKGFPVSSGHGATGGQVGKGEQRASFTTGDKPTDRKHNSVRDTVFAAGAILVLWVLPTLLAFLMQGPGGTFFAQGFFFSKAALVTFGGAYAVLPYVAQQAVEKYAWLTPTQMLEGLALAETTPGPLIMVLQFVGFLGGWNHPGSLPPLLAGTLGALITTWCTFAPSFAFIFLGAPYLEQMRGNAGISAALSAITAAVVGVIVNLAIWFGGHVLWPEPGRFDWFALAISVAGLIALTRFKWGVIPLVFASGCIGLVWKSFVA